VLDASKEGFRVIWKAPIPIEHRRLLVAQIHAIHDLQSIAIEAEKIARAACGVGPLGWSQLVAQAVSFREVAASMMEILPRIRREVSVIGSRGLARGRDEGSSVGSVRWNPSWQRNSQRSLARNSVVSFRGRQRVLGVAASPAGNSGPLGPPSMCRPATAHDLGPAVHASIATRGRARTAWRISSVGQSAAGNSPSMVSR